MHYGCIEPQGDRQRIPLRPGIYSYRYSIGHLPDRVSMARSRGGKERRGMAMIMYACPCRHTWMTCDAVSVQDSTHPPPRLKRYGEGQAAGVLTPPPYPRRSLQGTMSTERFFAKVERHNIEPKLCMLPLHQYVKRVEPIADADNERVRPEGRRNTRHARLLSHRTAAARLSAH